MKNREMSERSYYRIRGFVEYNNTWNTKQNAMRSLREIRKDFNDKSAKLYLVTETWKEVKVVK